MKTGAKISECGNYRYYLYRHWGINPKMGFIMLNPSTADENTNDRTINKCIKIAERYGYGGINIANLFAIRSTDKSYIKKVADPIGPNNVNYLYKVVVESDIVVLAWGVDGKYMDRSNQVLDLFNKSFEPYCLKICKDGEPGHPLYLKNETELKRYYRP